jgi:hypothetical protein
LIQRQFHALHSTGNTASKTLAELPNAVWKKMHAA